MNNRLFGDGNNPLKGRRTQDLIIFGIGAILIIVLLITVIRNRNANNTLEVYDESNVVLEEETDETEDLDIETTIYTYTVGASISIPADWERVTKSGYDTYVHPATGSSIQVQVLDYDPTINNMDEQTASVDVAEKGMTFMSYTRNTSSSYELMYQDYQNATYDYIEEVYWDRDNIIKLVCTLNDAYYTDIIPYYEYILNSFAWNKADPIPEDMVLWYLETGDFEFAYPLDWSIAEADTTIVAVSKDNTAEMTVSLSEYQYSLEDVTASDLSGLIGSGRANYMLNEYDSSSTKAEATSTYVNGSVQYTNKTYLFANGMYLYTLSFDYEDGTIDDSVPEESAGLFREFISDKIAKENSGDITDAEEYEMTKDEDAE